MLDGRAVGLEREIGEGEERLVLAGEREPAAEDGVEQALVADLVHRQHQPVGTFAEGDREGATQRREGLVAQPGESIREGRAAALDIPVGGQRAGLVHLERAVGCLAQEDATLGTPDPLELAPVRDLMSHGLHLGQGRLAHDSEDCAHQRGPFRRPVAGRYRVTRHPGTGCRRGQSDDVDSGFRLPADNCKKRKIRSLPRP